MSDFILISKLKIQNANALSSPLTVGFPAMTAWLGFTHLLQRRLHEINNDYKKLRFLSTGVVVHDFRMLQHKDKYDSNYSLIGMKHPLKKDGKSPSFIEEARCHLTASIVIKCNDLDNIDKEIIEDIQKLILTLKVAGGDILSVKEIKYFRFNEDDEASQEFKNLKIKLMPGYIVKERSDLMKKSFNQGEDTLDGLLDYLKVNNLYEKIENTKNEEKENQKDKYQWLQSRKERGWIVPIATGFHGFTKLKKAENQRDDKTPHCFAESVITLGEFVMAYRIKTIDEMLWQYQYDNENSLYLCNQN
jgi:CRISPR-associated protein Csy2